MPLDGVLYVILAFFHDYSCSPLFNNFKQNSLNCKFLRSNALISKHAKWYHYNVPNAFLKISGQVHF